MALMASDGAITSPRARRRDAEERRQALISAAAIAFAEQGYGVSLETIAGRAGVGRATLYRNFHDRAALALAIFSREVDRLRDSLDLDAPLSTTLTRMVTQGAAAASLFARIAADLHAENPNAEAFHALGDRLEAVLAPAVRAAITRQEVAASITPREIVLAMRMVAGLILPFMHEDEIAAQVAEALSLLMGGLRPR